MAGIFGLLTATAFVLVACGGSSLAPGPTPAPGALPTTAPGSSPTPSAKQQTSAPAALPTPEQPTKTAAVDLPRDFQLSVYRGADVLGGKELRFSAIFATGKPVILNFFAGLCPPCRAEMPDIQSVANQYQGRVLFFGLDIGPFVGLGDREDGKLLVQELGITYPTGTTLDGNTVRAYQVLGMPTTLFMTPEGKVFRKWTGLLTKGKLVELTEGLLKSR